MIVWIKGCNNCNNNSCPRNKNGWKSMFIIIIPKNNYTIPILVQFFSISYEATSLIIVRKQYHNIYHSHLMVSEATMLVWFNLEHFNSFQFFFSIILVHWCGIDRVSCQRYIVSMLAKIWLIRSKFLFHMPCVLLYLSCSTLTQFSKLLRIYPALYVI